MSRDAQVPRQVGHGPRSVFPSSKPDTTLSAADSNDPRQFSPVSRPIKQLDVSRACGMATVTGGCAHVPYTA